MYLVSNERRFYVICVYAKVNLTCRVRSSTLGARSLNLAHMHDQLNFGQEMHLISDSEHSSDSCRMQSRRVEQWKTYKQTGRLSCTLKLASWTPKLVLGYYNQFEWLT